MRKCAHLQLSSGRRGEWFTNLYKCVLFWVHLHWHSQYYVRACVVEVPDNCAVTWKENSLVILKGDYKRITSLLIEEYLQ